MSREVDERVVSMRFDNQQFERGVHTSLGTLEKLKNGLNLDSSAKSLENVNDEVKKFNFSPLTNGLETVKAKFSALEVMGITALANITNSAVNAGKRIASALTIEPVKSGFQEYETQINAVQTILANTQSKGTTLDDVNKALDTLNTYADKTIYNFTEMTRNIGTFTAAGIGLQTSVDAIQGIANLAAVSGSTSQQASTAMYQLSQALAAGTVHLQDWNSVVNAGMGGQVFQDALKETSRAMAKNAKTLANMSKSEIEDFKKLNGYTDEQIESMKAYSADVDAIIEQKGSFRESLQMGWITSDVLTETLQKMTMATEGLTDAEVDNMKAMLRSRGYTEKQIEEIFKMGNTATNAATKVKTFTQLWDTLKEAAQSGWTQTWEIFVGDFEEAKALLTSISDVVGNMISKSAEARNNLLQSWKDMGGRTQVIDGLTNICKALWSVITDVKEAFHEVFPSVTAKQLISVTENFKSFTIRVRQATDELKKNRTLVEAFKGLFSILKLILNVGGAVVKIAVSIIKSCSGLFEFIVNIASALGKGATAFSNFVSKTNLFRDGTKAISGFVGNIVKQVTELVKLIGKIFTDPKDLGVYSSILKTVNGIFFSIVDTVKKIGNGIGNLFQIDGAAKFLDILKNIGSVFKTLIGQIGNGVSNGIFTNLFGFVNVGIEASLIGTIKKFINELKGVLEGFNDIPNNIGKVLGGVRKSLNAFSNSLNAKALMQIAKAIAVLAVALLVLSSIDEDKLESGLSAITTVMIDLVIALKAVASGKKNITGAATTISLMNGIATAVLILAGALRVIGSMDWDSLAKGLTGVFALMAMLAGYSILMSKMGVKGVKGTVSLIIFASSLKILASVCTDLGSLNTEKLTKGLIGMASMMAMLAGYSILMSKTGAKAAKGAVKIVIFASGLKIMASVAKDLSMISWQGLAKALAGISVMLVGILAYSKVASKMGKGMVSGAVGIMAFAVAMKALTKPLLSIAELSWENLAKGLTAFAVLLTGIYIFCKTCKMNREVLTAVGGIVALASAIQLMAKTSEVFAKMSWEETLRGITALGALMAEIGIFSRTIGKSEKLISSSVGLAAMGAAMRIFAADVKSFADMGIANAAVGLTAMGVAMAEIAGVMRIMPSGKALAATGAGLVVVSVALGMMVPSIRSLGNMSWENVATGLAALGGSLGLLAGGLRLMNGTAKGSGALVAASAALMLLTPQIKILGSIPIELAAGGLIAMAGALTVMGLASKLLKPVIPPMKNLAKAVALFGAGCALAGIGVTALTTAIVAFSASGLAAGVALTNFFGGLADALAAVGGKLAAAIASLVGTALVSLISTALIPAISTALDTLRDYLPKIIDSLADILIGVMDGLSIKIPAIVKSAVNMLKEFISALNDSIGGDGIKDIFVSLACVSAVMLAFAKAAQIVSNLENPAKAMGKALIGMGAAVIGLVAVLAALGGLEQIPGLDWLISEGSKLFNLIGNAIGEFVGNIVNGLIKAAPKDLEQVVNSIASIGSVAAAIAPLTKLLAHIDIKSAAKGIAGFAIIIGGVTAILAALGGLAQIPGFNDIISSGVTMFSAIGNALGAFLGSLVDGLAKAVTTNIEDTVKSIVAVGLVIGTTALIVKLISALHIDPAGTATGIASLAIAIGGLAVILAALGGLKQIPGFDWIISEGSVVLDKIGNALGSFVGNIISGIATGFTSGLPEMAQNLSDFMTNIQPFIDGAKNIDPKIADNIGGLVAAVMAITASNVVESIASFFTGCSSMEKFGDSVGMIGSALQKFSDSITGIDTASIQQAASASKYLADAMAIIPKEGGAIEQITGSSNLSEFGDYISSFGEGLRKFSDSSKGVDTGLVRTAAEAAGALIDVANRVPNNGGLAGWFAGENPISGFGKDIESFGVSLKIFSDSVQGVDTDTVTVAANAAASIISIANDIPNNGGVASWFAGDNNIADFGYDLTNFGPSLKIFSDSVKGINPDTVTAAANAAASMISVADSIPNNGGVAQWFAGEKDISQFGDKLKSFGPSLKIFSDSVKGINPDAVTAAANATVSLISVTNGLENTGGLAQVFAGSKDISQFGNQLASFGGYLQQFSDNVSNLNTENVSVASSAAGELVAMASAVPTNIDVGTFGNQVANLGIKVSDFTKNMAGVDPSSAIENTSKLIKMTSDIKPETVSSLSDFTESLGTAAQDGIVRFSSAFGDNSVANIADTVNNWIAKIIEKLNSGASKFADVGKKLVQSFWDAAKDKFNGVINEFYNMGVNVDAGFSNGIGDNTELVISAVRRMADEAVKAAKDELDIHSPSKVFESLGDYSGQGFVNGLINSSDKTYSAGADMAENAKQGLADTISRISDAINGEVDCQPTITPVLDMSQVESQAASLNSMFSSKQAMNVSAGIDYNSRAKLQNGGNITSQSSGNTYNFNQNITSPKALDATTIYRQTRNQFSRLKEATSRI